MKKKALIAGLALSVVGLTALGCTEGKETQKTAEVKTQEESGNKKENPPKAAEPEAKSSGNKETNANENVTKNEDAAQTEETGNSEETENEIPPQGFTQCMLYDIDGGEILVKQAEDGYWYDENGVSFGYWTDFLNSNEAGFPVSDENGKLYYWTSEGHDGSEIPLQGAFGAILFDKDGNSVTIHLYGGSWYDEDNVCYGTGEEVDAAGINGSPVTNENGETYYWTYPE